MYPSAETRLVLSQVIQINLFARINKVFKLMLLTIFVKSTIMDFLSAPITPLNCSKVCNYLRLYWLLIFVLITCIY